MDVEKVMVRKKFNNVLNKIFNIEINQKVFHVKIVEDSQRPIRIIFPTNRKSKTDRSDEDDYSYDKDDEKHIFRNYEDESTFGEEKSKGCNAPF